MCAPTSLEEEDAHTENAGTMPLIVCRVRPGGRLLRDGAINICLVVEFLDTYGLAGKKWIPSNNLSLLDYFPSKF